MEAAATIRRGDNRINRLRRKCGVEKIADAPHAIRDALRGCWRGPQAFVNAAQIVERDMATAWLSSFVENALVRRAKPRQAIRMERLLRPA